MNFIKHTVFLCLLFLQVYGLSGMFVPTKQPEIDHTFHPLLSDLVREIRLKYDKNKDQINELIIKGYIRSLGTIDQATKEKIHKILYTREIQKLYFKLAKEFHPDKIHNHADEQTFKQLTDIKENASIALPPYSKLISNFKVIIKTNKLKEKLLNKEKKLNEDSKTVPIAILIYKIPQSTIGQCAFFIGNKIGKNLSEHFFGNEKKEGQLNAALSKASAKNLKNLELIEKYLNKKVHNLGFK